MKNLFFTLELVPYNIPLHIGYNISDKKLDHHLQKCGVKKVDRKFLTGDFSADATTYHSSAGIFLIRFKEVKGSADIAGLVAHEAFHVVTDMFDYIGDKYSGMYNSESYAYLLQYITTTILKKIL
jgi:hypothetical protein